MDQTHVHSNGHIAPGEERPSAKPPIELLRRVNNTQWSDYWKLVALTTFSTNMRKNNTMMKCGDKVSSPQFQGDVE